MALGTWAFTFRRRMAPPLLALFAAAAANAQLTDTGCGGATDKNGEAQGVCSIGTSEFWANGSGACDFGLKSTKNAIDSMAGAGVCINDTRNTQSDSGSWAQWALAQQRQIAGDLPYNMMLKIGTHNSFSNMAEGDTNWLNTNQYYSITDQLNLGVRSIRLDPHYYFGQLRTCHADSNTECILLAGYQYLFLANFLYPVLIPINLLPAPIPELIDPIITAALVVSGSLGEAVDQSHDLINNRLFVSNIREINDWLVAHPKEFIELNLNTMDDEYLEGNVQAMVLPMVNYFGSRIYTATDLTNDIANLGRYATLNELVSRGKQVVINSDEPETLAGDTTGTIYTVANYVYPSGNKKSVNVPSIYPGSDASYFNTCTISYTDPITKAVWNGTIPAFLIAYPLLGARTSEARTGSDFLSGFTGLVDEPQVQQAVACGYTEIDFDFFMNRSQAFGPYANTSPDLRREASIWSWDQGQQPLTGVAAMQVGADASGSKGRWVSAPYLATGYSVACVEQSDATTATYPRTWHVPASSGDWYSSAVICSENKTNGVAWTFDHPRNALDNAALQAAAAKVGASLVFLNYAPGTIQPAATGGTTAVYMDQGGAPPDPVPTLMDGERNLFFYPVETEVDPFYLLNLGNIGSTSAPIPFSAGPVNILTGILPDAQNLAAQGSGYAATFTADLYQSSGGSYSSYPYPGNFNPETQQTSPPTPATGGISLHVMTPTTTTLSMYPNSDGTYTAVITVNPTCGPAVTNNDTPQPTGTVHLVDTFSMPGGPPTVTDLGWVIINNAQDAGSQLGVNQLPVANCSQYLTLTANSGCGIVTLPAGHNSLIANYWRDSGFNSSSSAGAIVDVGGVITPSPVSFTFSTSLATQTQTVNWNGAQVSGVAKSGQYSWITVTGNNPFTVSVTPPDSLLPGVYTDNLTLSANEFVNGKATVLNLPSIPVQVNIVAPLTVDQTSLTFSSQDQSTPASQTLNLVYQGGPVAVQNSGAPWATVQITADMTTRHPTTATIVVTPNAAGISNGASTGTLLISQPGNPTAVPVTVTLNETITGNVPAIAFTTTPSNMKFICDQNTYTAPYTLLDPKAGTHNCAGVTTIQNVAAGTRALFQGWSDGQPGLVRTITATAGTPQNFGITYRLQNEVSVTVDPVCSGTVSPLQSWYNPGTQVTLAASPASGYTFVGYSGDIDTTSASLTQYVYNPANVVAHFVCSGTGCASNLAPLVTNMTFASGNLNQRVNFTASGTPVNFEIGGGLPSWLKVNANQMTTPANIQFTIASESLPTARGSYTAEVTIHPTNGTTDAVVEVELDMDTVVINTDPVGAQVLVDGQVYTTQQGQVLSFSWISGSQHNLGAPGNSSPTERYVFQSWSDGGQQDHPITTPVYPAPVENLKAEFNLYYALTLTPNPTGGGTITAAGTELSNYFLANNFVTLTAVPATNYVFTSFTGALSGTANPQKVNMNGPVTVTANFTLSGASPCKVTGDASVTVADIQSTINQALGITSGAGDVNHDGVVNVSDVQIVVTAAMTGTCM